jgi:RNA-directed DNA polymerase
MKSWWACLLAVRRVTQANQGKRTAGVDGVRNLRPSLRLALARHLQANPLLPKSPPVRRVWIPKPGTPEQRPLGIPVMEQRARQALVKLALEPEWEAKFEPNSYGFRPGRSAHDAIEAIFISIHTQAKYVLDADIAHCFDRIDQTVLLTKLQTFPKLRNVIKAWLKAGLLDGDDLFPSTEGVPQGGVLSPLLTNVALHGMEQAVAQRFRRRERNGSYRVPSVIRYADDVRRSETAREDTSKEVNTREMCCQAPTLLGAGNSPGTRAWWERPEFCRSPQTTEGRARLDRVRA